MMTAELIESRLRRFLLVLTLFIFMGTVVELVLQEHTGETLQLIPFFLCAIGGAAVLAALLRPGRSTLLALRGVMVLVAGGGMLGSVLHLVNNFAFQQEIRPNAAATDLVIETLHGANPLLAPGILIFAAVLALAATYYHPALGKRSSA